MFLIKEGYFCSREGKPQSILLEQIFRFYPFGVANSEEETENSNERLEL